MENYFQVKVIQNTKIPKLDVNILYQNKFIPDYSDIFINKILFKKLNNCVNKTGNLHKNIDNLFIYGNKGQGKYTLAKYYIKEYIDNNLINNISNEKYEYNNKEIEYYRSRYHYEIMINRYNFNDTNVVYNLLEKITNKNVILKDEIKKNIILIKNVHLLNNNIIRLLKCYIEKNYINNVFILISDRIYPSSFRGLFVSLNVPIIKMVDYIKLGEYILNEEKIKYKKSELKYIYSISDNSLNKFKNILELSYINGKYEKYKDVKEDKFKFLCKLIKKNDYVFMEMIREILNDLLVENIDYKELLYYLINYFSKMEDIKKRNEILQVIYNCDINISKSYRILHHLEYLFIKIINIYNNN